MNGAFVSTLAVAAAISFLLDAIAVPRAPLRRPLVSLSLHILSVAFLVNLVLAATSRPVFSACASLGLIGLVAAVSNAKYESLREPFVFTDLSLFSQLFSHPRLYLPFLSVGKVVAIGAGIVFVIAGFVVERPVFAGFRALAWLAVGLSFVLAVIVAARLSLTLDPVADQRRYGFFAVFVAYLLNGLRPATFRRFGEVMAAGLFATGEPVRRPDMIVIQSESFFDARRLGDTVAPALFRRFDEARHEAIRYGELTVPAWGANTMRTEFAVLTGTESFSLRYARFYPYAFVRNKVASLASWFDRCGYDTVAIHPYYADFFGRHRVFPLLGFTRFLDIRHFGSASRAGPYVADAAVSESIVAELEAADDARPRFIFAMTMENHGPLHLEEVLPGESSSRHTLGEDASWRDLTAYLRHIENADAMIGRLIDYLRTSKRETVVCFYGDHVPALPHVFQKLGVMPQRSDYFIWRNYGTDAPECRNLAAEELGAALLHVVQDDGNRTEQPCASEKAT
ncbi:LTA synthase family protein [Burkholderia cenocepacia]|uniref:LTA synthase family protein n=1 Tax=Burkholderia cenocepacia TaxID=95486 RepID=UPI0020A04ABE|nr:LTA synthase family protein [Burkholderia cenocepacia]MCO8322945.1 LTA synthase family protein [Burkholderia cenocepacia]MCO8330433.1 LTA synthase family protein [Burkholderia cenocepacia]MCO8337718.1 LTA synthase family protein [Burkholderia cenocepacia]MCO8344800.1 LTA synthase family protein [Burkholderia cenocepacia]MCO8358083.1 LTA synthase family protein [Burkholderia cenocepacia]